MKEDIMSNLMSLVPQKQQKLGKYAPMGSTFDQINMTSGVGLYEGMRQKAGSKHLTQGSRLSLHDYAQLVGKDDESEHVNKADKMLARHQRLGNSMSLPTIDRMHKKKKGTNSKVDQSLDSSYFSIGGFRETKGMGTI